MSLLTFRPPRLSCASYASYEDWGRGTWVGATTRSDTGLQFNWHHCWIWVGLKIGDHPKLWFSSWFPFKPTKNGYPPKKDRPICVHQAFLRVLPMKKLGVLTPSFRTGSLKPVPPGIPKVASFGIRGSSNTDANHVTGGEELNTVSGKEWSHHRWLSL